MTCCSFHTNKRVDPTRTIMLRRAFESDFIKRFKKLKSAITQAVVDSDGFGLKTNAGLFDFPTTADKVGSFMQWLDVQQQQDIIRVVPGVSSSRAATGAWTTKYIESAYKKGIQRSAQELRGQGVDVADSWIDDAFFRPVNADRVQLLYTRTYTDLNNITQNMDTQISRILSQGLIDGLSPNTIAAQINKRVDSIGLVRARTLARTEIIRAHNVANISGYREAGAEGVNIQAEFSTAGDSDVCPECEALDGKEMSLDEAERLIPVHPNCRCVALPLVKNPEKVRLQ